MSRKDALNLLVPAQAVPDVFEAEAEQQIAEDGFPGFAAEATQVVRAC